MSLDTGSSSESPNVDTGIGRNVNIRSNSFSGSLRRLSSADIAHSLRSHREEENRLSSTKGIMLTKSGREKIDKVREKTSVMERELDRRANGASEERSKVAEAHGSPATFVQGSSASPAHSSNCSPPDSPPHPSRPSPSPSPSPSPPASLSAQQTDPRRFPHVVLWKFVLIQKAVRTLLLGRAIARAMGEREGGKGGEGREEIVEKVCFNISADLAALVAQRLSKPISTDVVIQEAKTLTRFIRVEGTAPSLLFQIANRYRHCLIGHQEEKLLNEAEERGILSVKSLIQERVAGEHTLKDKYAALSATKLELRVDEAHFSAAAQQFRVMLEKERGQTMEFVERVESEVMTIPQIEEAVEMLSSRELPTGVEPEASVGDKKRYELVDRLQWKIVSRREHLLREARLLVEHLNSSRIPPRGVGNRCRTRSKRSLNNSQLIEPHLWSVQVAVALLSSELGSDHQSMGLVRTAVYRRRHKLIDRMWGDIKAVKRSGSSDAVLKTMEGWLHQLGGFDIEMISPLTELADPVAFSRLVKVAMNRNIRHLYHIKEMGAEKYILPTSMPAVVSPWTAARQQWCAPGTGTYSYEYNADGSPCRTMPVDALRFAVLSSRLHLGGFLHGSGEDVRFDRLILMMQTEAKKRRDSATTSSAATNSAITNTATTNSATTNSAITNTTTTNSATTNTATTNTTTTSSNDRGKELEKEAQTHPTSATTTTTTAVSITPTERGLASDHTTTTTIVVANASTTTSSQDSSIINRSLPPEFRPNLAVREKSGGQSGGRNSTSTKRGPSSTTASSHRMVAPLPSPFPNRTLPPPSSSSCRSPYCNSSSMSSRRRRRNGMESGGTAGTSSRKSLHPRDFDCNTTMGSSTGTASRGTLARGLDREELYYSASVKELMTRPISAAAMDLIRSAKLNRA